MTDLEIRMCFSLSMACMVNYSSFLYCVGNAYDSLDIMFADPTTNLLTSGPYGLIFASFVPFYFDIPVSTWFRIFGVRFSDKSFIYLAGLQVYSE